MRNLPFLMLAPYGRDLWSGILQRLPLPCGTTIDGLDRDDDLGRMAERLLVVAPPRFGVLGYCMGGYLAFEMLRRAPQRIVRLALVSTGPHPDTPGQKQARLLRISKLEAKATGLTHPDGAYVDQAAKWLLSPASCRKPAIVRRARKVIAAIPVSVSANQQKAMVERPDSLPVLRGFAGRALIVAGDEDRVIPPDHALDMAKAMPMSSCRILPACGHLAPLEAPAALAAHLADWLSARHR